jgi:Na+/melibiose symporter-like transporter
MLPSMTFSPNCRSTLNGISAASGKVGALIGAVVFEPAAKAFGNGTVMLFCALLSSVGMIMTVTSVRSDVGLGEGTRIRSASSFTRKQSMPSFLDYN